MSTLSRLDFPQRLPVIFEAVKAIADENRGPIICGLARCNAEDIEKVHAAVKGADNHRIHVFVATSAIHREYKLKMAKEEIIRSAVGAIKLARELCDDVEFSPEDASRTELAISCRGGLGSYRGWREHRQYSGYCRAIPFRQNSINCLAT